MDIDCTYLPYNETAYFTDLVLDYLDGSDALKNYYKYTPDKAGIKQAIEQRPGFPVNRQLLVNTLQKQYEGLQADEKVTRNIQLLSEENTFTICTAHQPNLLTGYLYFIYKIVHAIKLADELNSEYPGKHFVPVYYMGSEDNDLEELGTFRYAGQKFVWDAQGQTGAVGRMKTDSLKPLLFDLFKLLGPPGTNAEQLQKTITEAYLKHNTIADATQYLVNELFGRFGLVILNPDDAELKRAILPILQDDLENHIAYAIVNETTDNLGEQYKIQAHPRYINLFYMKDNIRERIEKKGGQWIVLNTDIKWTAGELKAELEQHPDRFSPNVILRGIFQESILPDIAFIGGGAEVAYWLELKDLFHHYKVFYPTVLLRQSVQWITPQQDTLRKKLGFSVADMFKSESSLIRYFIAHHGTNNWQTADEMNAIEEVLMQLKQKANALDVTLNASAEAVLARIRKQLVNLEKKMLRAEKRKMQDQVQRIINLKNSIFPDYKLQERQDNFVGYYAALGPQYLDVLYNNIAPLRNQFLVISQQA